MQEGTPGAPIRDKEPRPWAVLLKNRQDVFLKRDRRRGGAGDHQESGDRKVFMHDSPHSFVLKTM
ncbi:MAG TPA: hypothetical protein VFC10_03335, partial [Terriglobia bacterium]|nr:hypothetical protein [Terriglobia bacterium]